jgi:hypothetical protein
LTSTRYAESPCTLTLPFLSLTVSRLSKGLGPYASLQRIYVPSWHLMLILLIFSNLKQVLSYLHSLHFYEPSDGFLFSTLCLSVGLVHFLHRYSSILMISLRFIDALLASSQCTPCRASSPRVFNNSGSHEIQLLGPHKSLSFFSSKGYLFPLVKIYSKHSVLSLHSVQ